jgi:hypothetical protein
MPHVHDMRETGFVVMEALEKLADGEFAGHW